jgi:hypothetical protein
VPPMSWILWSYRHLGGKESEAAFKKTLIRS